MKTQYLLLLFFLSSPLWAQEVHVLKGLVTNAAGAPVEAVTCILTDQADSTHIDATITDLDGRFTLNNLPAGNYLLTLQHLLYESTSLVVAGGKNVELDTIVLTEKSLELAGVTISGQRPLVKAQEGKLVYDVPQLIQNKIATNAFEALKTIPNVAGGGDDIQLVGTDSYTILINGQPTSLSATQLIQVLKSTPASKVKNIEVMYSAPPQYNVRGAAINVILGEDGMDIPTFQGEGNLAYEQATYAGYSARGNIVYNKPNLTTDLTIVGGHGKVKDNNTMHAIHHLDNQVYDIQQHNSWSPIYTNVNTRLALDYTLPNKDKLDFTYTGEYGKTSYEPNSTATYRVDNMPYATILSRADNDGDNWLHNLKLAYDSHVSFKAGADYTFYNDAGNQRYSDYENELLLHSYKTKTNQQVGKLVAYANHTATTASGWQWNYGVNFGYSRNKIDYNWFAAIAGNTPDSVSLTHQTEYSGSLFAGFTKSFTEKFSMQASLSGNYFHASVDNSVTGEKTLWDEFTPFVNANLTYVFAPQHILQGAFTSDVQYPPYWALSPDETQMNAYSVVRGNPQLKFAKSYEGQLIYIFKSKYMLIGSYKHYADQIIQLPYQSATELTNIFQAVNLDYRRQASLSLVVPVKWNKLVDARGTCSYIYIKDKDTDFYAEPYANSINTFMVNITNTTTLSGKPNIKLELSGFYMNGAIQGVYRVSHLSRIDAGLKWVFPGDRAELTAKATDIFSGSDAHTTIDFADQWSKMTVYSDTPSFKLSFTYRFGNYKKKQVEGVDKSRFGRGS